MKSLFGSVYRGRRVLVTGHTGFKGSWLTMWLTDVGAEVLGYSLMPPTQPNLFDAAGISKRIRHVIGDVKDSEHLVSVMDEFRPEMVFHLAAQPIVRRSYLDPKGTYDTNVSGTVNLLEAVRTAGSVRTLIVVTSDKCYENQGWVYGYRETDQLGGYDPYSSSKACAEIITAAYRRSFFERQGIAVSSVRAGNVVGGGDWAEDRLIPDCVRAITVNKPIVIRNPNAIRPWQHVLDALAGYLRLGSLMWNEPERFAGAWNFGPRDQDVLRVDELVRLITGEWGEGAVSLDMRENPHEAMLLRLDVSKAQTLLDWRPTYSAVQAIRQTVAWYKEFYQGASAALLCLSDLNEFVEAATKSGATWVLER